MKFREELQHLINRHSIENGSDTPDFLLAEFLEGCLFAFDRAIIKREAWYGRKRFLKEQITLTTPDPNSRDLESNCEGKPGSDG